MTKRLVNPVSVAPMDLQSGDVMAVVVTCHVCRGLGNMIYRLYRCPYPPRDSMLEGIPQGARIGNEEAVAAQLFPVVRSAKGIPDY